MADVMDLPPEPLPRDERPRSSEDRRRNSRDTRSDDRSSRRDYDERASSRDRNRDYKRRRSPSPPPYRDRRCSPSRRSSPSYKRYRDYGRGSSPRRIRGRDERRYYGSFSDSGHGGYSGGTGREGLMTYKQFISELEDDVSPTEAERRYEEYKTEFISTQKKAFFELNKLESWLRDKYDPSCLDAAIQRRNESCKEVAREFILELESGVINISPAASNRQDGRASGHASDEEEGTRRRSGHEPELGAAPKVPVAFGEPRRVAKDIEQTRALVRKLDDEKGIDKNVLNDIEIDQSGERTLAGGGMNPIIIVRGHNQVKGYEGIELLDVLLAYLWRVHYVDYYGSIEYKEPPKVLRHVRSEGKGVGDDARVCVDWENKIDAAWQARLQGQDPLELLLAKDKVETALAQALDPLVRKIKDEKYGWKYGCGAKNCTKLFHGPEYVHKHLKLKHSELVSELRVKVQDEIYFENYMSDPDAPGSTPVMATQRNGHGFRDQRDNEKPGREHRERENGQSPEYQAGGQFDAPGPMFDPFGGGMRGIPPFGADMGMPPPVLMPVPGAGPLGPFVPAPPEVAMRVWREQGAGAGPFLPGPPFDGEGMVRGGRNRLGPGLHNFRVESGRALRSYRDLDAPDDEVTVIDYRSL